MCKTSNDYIIKNYFQSKKEYEDADKDMDFMMTARLRDEMFKMQKELEGMKG